MKSSHFSGILKTWLTSCNDFGKFKNYKIDKKMQVRFSTLIQEKYYWLVVISC